MEFLVYGQVLDDGTIVRINKTRYSDVSEDGSSYFGFHSTSFVSNGNNENNPEEDAEESSGGEGENGMLTPKHCLKFDILDQIKMEILFQYEN